MKTLIIAAAFALTLHAQVSFSSFLSYVNTLPDSAARMAKADSFITAVQAAGGAPAIENNAATFLYRGFVSSAAVAGDFNNWQPSYPMTRISKTNLYYYTKTFEANARLDYKIVTNGSTWLLDPLNPRRCAGGFGDNSELAMPAYVQPWEIAYKSWIPHGTAQSFSFASALTGKTYPVTVYLPPGYAVNTATRYPAAYFHDGGEYINLGYAKNIFDNLLDSGRIQPVIGIFVTPTARESEYAGALRNQYRQFFVTELVPRIDSLYRTLPSAKNRAVIGTSYGANISALISYNHPEVFGKCGLHSSAFQPNNYEALNLLMNPARKNIDYNAVWGTYEGVYQYMRPLRDTLLGRGYQFGWQELPEGHSWGLWRATLDNMMKFFFPPGASKICPEQELPGSAFIARAYPNPFNASCVVEYNITRQGRVHAALFDITGTLLEEFDNGIQTPGTHRLTLNAARYASGQYFLRLSASGAARVLPLLLMK